MAFNDASALTCLGNDLGYENVFAKQIEFHGACRRSADRDQQLRPFTPISSRPSRRRARANCRVVTFSGFTEDNDLRRAGDINFFVQSSEYGFVEVAHLALCHAVLDIDMGWGKKA